MCLFLLLASVIWFSSLLLLDNYDSTLGEDQGLPTSLSQKAMVIFVIFVVATCVKVFSPSIFVQSPSHVTFWDVEMIGYMII